MAAKDLDSVDIKPPLDDITTCCICTEVYTDPIALPCIHTFCMKCLQETGLKTDKGPGDEMPCPICRRMWKIPSEGFHGLPKNFFIERLIQVTNLSDQSASSTPICDACVEENEEAGKDVPAADTYCVDCNQKFCQECCRQHRKFKLTKNHCLLPINEYEGGQNVMIAEAPSVCELHEHHILNIYCTDCKTVVCAMCFIDDHYNHKGSDVNKFVDGFRKQIESNVKAMNECRSKAETKKAELLRVKEGIQERVENLECDVETRKDELKQFTDEHATSLLQGLYSIRQSKLKELQMTTDDVDTYLSSLETYNSYCQEIMAKGSANDICRTFSDLSLRAVDLQQQCQLMTEREIESFNFCFQKSELGEFLRENCVNLIGEIEEEGDSTTEKRIKPSLLSQQSNEIERLRNEIKSEIANRESLRLSIVQLRINTNKEVQANHKIFTEELNRDKAYNDVLIKKLRQKLENNRITCNTLQTENEQLKQKLDATIVTNISLQDQNDKLKQELEKEEMTNNFVQAGNNRFVQEVNTAYKTTIKALEDDVKKPKQELETAQTVELPCKLDPVFIQMITAKSTNGKKKMISGLTILDKELLLVCRHCSEVEVHDLMRLTLNRRWNLKELLDPMDLGSCSRNKCIYIFDDKGARKPKEILRVDPYGHLIKNWSTGNDWGWGLSVTDESNVLLTLYSKGNLKEYSPDGQLIREINLSADSCDPWHAIRLTNGHFVVSSGMHSYDIHSVCIVDGDGKLVKSVGSGHGMKRPVYLSVDVNGFVMVVDQLNSRVLLFDSDLQFKKEILSKANGLQHPWRILVDESNGRLYVVDNDSTDAAHIILIFDVK